MKAYAKIYYSDSPLFPDLWPSLRNAAIKQLQTVSISNQESHGIEKVPLSIQSCNNSDHLMRTENDAFKVYTTWAFYFKYHLHRLFKYGSVTSNCF